MAGKSTTKRKLTDEPELLPTAAPLSPDELHNRIAARAYELFLARNGSGGDATSDWLLAEMEVRNQIAAVTSLGDGLVTTKRKRVTTSKSTTPRSSKPKTPTTSRPSKSTKSTSTSQTRTRKQKQAEE